jgi:c-di-GMP-related signal transduction protein
MDKKGFLIGIRSAIKRIMSKKAYKLSQVRQALQDSSREFITLIAYVSAIEKASIPTLLYKGNLGDLQDS